MEWSKVWRAVKMVAFNLIILNSVIIYPVHQVQMYLGMRYRIDDMPSVIEVLLHFVVFVVTQEVIFYYTHRYVSRFLSSFSPSAF